MIKANETISTLQKKLEAENEALREESLLLTQQLVNNQRRHEALMKELASPVIAVQGEVADDATMKIDRFQQVVSRSSLKGGMKVNTAFDEYELIAQIGQGGCGRVFSAKNSDGEMFAIKFLDKHIGRAKLKRFKNEINFCEHSSHVNIVKVVDRGCVELENNDEYIFCVMPLYEQSLRDKMRAGVQHQTAVDIFLGLLQGLQYAHRKGIIHRDIKPENIMFAKASTVPIICDFGIAHFSENELMTIVETKPTDRLANFAYAAPEQRKKGGVAVPQTDLFAAGLILNEMFTKSVPQGGGYRTIKDVAPNYAFLDKIVERLYRNVPQERLFPEDKIISEMKVLAEIDKNEKEARRLRAIVNETTVPDVIDLKVVDKRYENSSIVFVMSQDVPPAWFSFLAHGEYSHESVWGYGTDNLIFDGGRKISMPLHDLQSEEKIKSIVKHFQEWLPIANAIYADWIEHSAKMEQEDRERQRRLEIARIEKENKIRQVLTQL